MFLMLQRGRTSGRVTAGFAAALLTSTTISSPLYAGGAQAPAATTPIEHVIVIVGENRTFDHLFATYVPNRGQSVSNLLSKGIITAAGAPGPNFGLAQQYLGSLKAPAKFSLVPTSKTVYKTLPPPNTTYAQTVGNDTTGSPFKTLAAATAYEGLALPAIDLPLLTSGATGLAQNVIDTRVLNALHLANKPFQLSPNVSDDDYSGDPIHRFYQMWQQFDCSVAQATPANPSGCLADLFPWVATTIGTGSNGNPPPVPFNIETTHQGAVAMGFYNVLAGDMSYFNSLAHQYAINDNFHQSVMGGTGANSIMIGAGDAYYFTDGLGHAAKPPANQIENPDPMPGTNNWYTQDGYGGGSYSNCSDQKQPGVGAIVSYLAALPYKPKPNCAPGHYYLLNNYDPGYNGDGSLHAGNPFTIPPSPVRTIADVLLAKGVSWKYYGQHWNEYVKNSPLSDYCNICNPFLYETAIMTKPVLRTAHLQDTLDLYSDIAKGTLPAVSFVKPGGLVDGHPGYSKFDLFEAFTARIINAVKAKPELWAHTAIFITVDEGGGYYDSGYIQPLDFFGDGTRIPLIVVSPFTKGGRVAHEYGDHVSILKFIEKNWQLPKITARSRDNMPNPIATAANPYVPTNGPAIGDLFSMFKF